MVGVRFYCAPRHGWTRACRGVHAYDRTRFYSRAFRAMRVAQGCTFPVFAHDTANLSLRVRKCVSACAREHMCDLAAVNRVFIVAATWQYMRTLMSYCTAVRQKWIAIWCQFLYFRSLHTRNESRV